MQGRKGANQISDSLTALESTNVEALVERRSSPGMLVVAAPMRLIHMNQTAWELIQDLNEVEQGQNEESPKTARGLLPQQLRELCSAVLQHLRGRPNAKDWERFELKRLVGLPDHPVLIRAFGVPDHTGRDQSRVVVLLEEIGRRKEEFNQETADLFRLTDREQAVIQCLAKGWTNKEIAASLKLALPTVKEHIRHIMEKTKTTTRTGILVQVFRVQEKASPRSLPLRNPAATAAMSRGHHPHVSTQNPRSLA